MTPEVQKSTRHSKITGDFAEYLILYWLSKHGWECARVDHVGMDLIARHPKAECPIGISVKARSRNPGTEGTYLSIPNENFQKLSTAAQAFGCEPYFAIVVDEAGSIDAFILSSSTLQDIHPQRQKVSSWKMGRVWRDKYDADARIMRFKMEVSTLRWWQ